MRDVLSITMLQKARLSLLLPLLGLACFLSLHLYLPRHLIAVRSVPQVNTPTSPVIQHASPDSVRIYIGVVTAWWNFSARLILRETYAHFKLNQDDEVTVRFVIGQPSSEDVGMLRFLKWEQERFGDLQILNQTENMNNGKSYEYFADLARMYPSEDPVNRPWDYAMKADDDTLINIPQLVETLRYMRPRLDTYIGRGTDYWHMGAGYILSWDLVTWLGKNRIDEFMNWNEDQGIGEMLKAGNKGKNFVNLGQQVMDHPSLKDSLWYREYGEDVILVHRLKNVHLQGDAIEYFLGRDRVKADKDKEIP